MNKIIFYCTILLLSCCSSEQSEPTITEPAKNISELINPNLTDINYAINDKNHYIVRNTQIHLNKLLLFIGGTGSTPQDYNLLCDYGATLGFDVISLSYPNSVAAASLTGSTDILAFDNYRDEICFGNQVSNAVSVDNLNCINTRLVKLINYLKNIHPDQNWNQYLVSSNAIDWTKVVVSGHSQGSGHACYFAKKKLVDRVLMFSGPNDYSTNFSAPANWLSQSGLTPINKYYALLHTQDEVFPFVYQVANLKAIGVVATNENPVLVDNLQSPYNNAKALSLNIAAISNHNAPIGGNSILPNIWKYMMIL